MSTQDETDNFPVSLDLSTAKSKAMDQAVKDFEEWSVKNPLPEGPVEINGQPIVNGWMTINPKIAREFLRRNPASANRKINFPTIVYYADQMKNNDWPATGQPILFTKDGTLRDGQHRLWAAMLSGSVFTTYVIMDVPDHPNLFAYIDNGKTRSRADALQTAGMNGVSQLIVKTLDISVNYERDLYTVVEVTRHERLAPVDYLRAIHINPNARAAAQLATYNFQGASALIDKEVVSFVTMKLLDLYDEDTAVGFFEEVEIEDIDETTWTGLLRKVMKEDFLKERKARMRKHIKLGMTIKALNHWLANDPVPTPVMKRNKREPINWELKANEAFPKIIHPDDLPPILETAAAE